MVSVPQSARQPQQKGAPYLAADESLLWGLPQEVLAHVLNYLSASDIINCASTCAGLRDVVLQDSLWHLLCKAKWGHLTEVSRWLVKDIGPNVRRCKQLADRSPQTYRGVYKLLVEYSTAVGLWSAVGSGAKGMLFTFSWQADCMAGFELQFESSDERPVRLPFTRVCPVEQCVAAEVVDENNIVIRQWPRINAETRSPSAEAAAAVAVSSICLKDDDSRDILGSSPQGSFEYQMMHFIKAQVAGGRSKRKKGLSRSPSQYSQGQWHVPNLYHLRRVPNPAPTPRHPLAGLWVGHIGGRGDRQVQVMLLSYDFSGSAARVVATKVTGDEHIPAGKQLWVASAAALPPPLPSAEQELVRQRWKFLEGGDDDEDEDELTFELQDDVGWKEDAQKQVVSCYSGKGAVAGQGYSNPAWCEGRLWLYADGSIGFLWLEYELLVDMWRVQPAWLL